MHEYIDYFLIVEAEGSPDAGFCFNRLKFLEWNRQVIFLPVRNIAEQFISHSDTKSREFLDTTINNILQLLTLEDDIIILGDIGTIIESEEIESFKN